MADTLRLRALPEALSIVRLPGETPPPTWAFSGPGIAAAVRRAGELGVVCATDRVPAGETTKEDGWTALEVEGPLDFSLTGILASIAAPLAESGVSIYALSTYDTDIVLVRTTMLTVAASALQAEGHAVDVSRVS